MKYLYLVVSVLCFVVGLYSTEIQNAWNVSETWKEAAIYHCQLNKSCEGVN